MHKRIYTVIVGISGICPYKLPNIPVSFLESQIPSLLQVPNNMCLLVPRDYKHRRKSSSLTKNSSKSVSKKTVEVENASLPTLSMHNLEIISQRYESKLKKGSIKLDELFDKFMCLEGFEKEVIVERKKLARRIIDLYSYLYNLRNTVCFDVPCEPINLSCKSQTSDSQKAYYREKKRMQTCNRSRARKRKKAERDFWMYEWEHYDGNDYDVNDYDLDDYKFNDLYYIDKSIFEELQYLENFLNISAEFLQTYLSDVLSDDTMTDITQLQDYAELRKKTLEHMITNFNFIKSVLG